MYDAETLPRCRSVYKLAYLVPVKIESILILFVWQGTKKTACVWEAQWLRSKNHFDTIVNNYNGEPIGVRNLRYVVKSLNYSAELIGFFRCVLGVDVTGRHRYNVTMHGY